ncbi:hypothetical protein LSAT2_020601 [Lamellibrachia satsuma]|nr:hypothetical protein LSAT2_020601 [Lamellibrachia satsuma]
MLQDDPGYIDRPTSGSRSGKRRVALNRTRDFALRRVPLAVLYIQAGLARLFTASQQPALYQACFKEGRQRDVTEVMTS